MIAFCFVQSISLTCAGLAQTLTADQGAVSQLHENILYLTGHTQDGLYACLLKETGCPSPHAAAHDAVHALALQELRNETGLMSGITDHLMFGDLIILYIHERE